MEERKKERKKKKKKKTQKKTEKKRKKGKSGFPSLHGIHAPSALFEALSALSEAILPNPIR